MDLLIRRATVADSFVIAGIGRAAVELSHRDSCSVADMNYFLDTYYNEEAIWHELNEPANIYHLAFYQGRPAGFSKVALNAAHPNIARQNAAKLDRIYLLSDYYDLKLGYHLLHTNIELAKANDQCGMWLFTWTGNERAVKFYKRNGFAVLGDHRFKVSDTHYNPHHHMMLQF